MPSKALKKAELDDGSEDTLDLVDFVMGEDETAIYLKVKALQKFAQRIIKNTTDGIYKTNGRFLEKAVPAAVRIIRGAKKTGT